MKELLKALSRPLDVSEIEFRVQSVKSKGGILLAYKTARTDMNILDESGLMWQKRLQNHRRKIILRDRCLHTRA